MARIYVTKVDETDDGWRFRCGHSPNVIDPQTGDTRPGEWVPSCFTSSQWPTKKAAQARAAEHENEHETGQPMTPLSVFRSVHKIEV